MGVRTAAALVTASVGLAALSGCTAAPDPQPAPADAAPPASSVLEPVPTPCADAVDGERAVCRFLTALDAGEPDGLSADEQDLLDRGVVLPRGTWEVEECDLDGAFDACRVVFGPASGEQRRLTFYVGEGESGGEVSFWESDLSEVSSELDGCPVADLLVRTACEYVNAVQTGDLDTLRPDEADEAARDEVVPDGAWRLGICELVGDVTSECVVHFPDEGASVVLTLSPVNSSYEDGTSQTDPGQELDYAVGGSEPLAG